MNNPSKLNDNCGLNDDEIDALRYLQESALTLATSVTAMSEKFGAKVHDLVATVKEVQTIVDAIPASKPVGDLTINEVEDYVSKIQEGIVSIKSLLNNHQSSVKMSSSQPSSSSIDLGGFDKCVKIIKGIKNESSSSIDPILSFGAELISRLGLADFDVELITNILKVDGVVMGGLFVTEVLHRKSFFTGSEIDIFCSTTEKATFVRNLVAACDYSPLSTNTSWENEKWTGTLYSKNGCLTNIIVLYHRRSDPEKIREPFEAEIDCITYKFLQVFYNGKTFTINDLETFKTKTHRFQSGEKRNLYREKSYADHSFTFVDPPTSIVVDAANVSIQ